MRSPQTYSVYDTARIAEIRIETGECAVNIQLAFEIDTKDDH